MTLETEWPAVAAPGSPEAQAQAEQRMQEPDQWDGSTWADMDLAETVAGIQDGTLQRPHPTLGRIDGGTALLYPGKVHGVHGIGGAGKTWLAACVIAERITAGEHVLLVDLEDTPATILERLLIDLQVSAEDVLARFHYKRPTEPALVGIEELRHTVTEHDVTLVVLDSVGEALAVDGVKQNEDAEVATWFARVARRTADLGPAVLLLDHVPKADEKALMPIGSQRKQAAMNGVIYSIQRKVPFSRDKAGLAVLVVGKDRQGAYAHGQAVAELRVTPDGDRSRVELVAPAEAPRSADGEFRPTHLMERASAVLEDAAEPVSGKHVTDRVGGKREYVLRALDLLVSEGYAAREAGPRGSKMHASIRPFREAEDTGNRSVPEPTPERPVPVPVPLGGEQVEQVSAPVPGTGREQVGNKSQAPTRGSICPTCGEPLDGPSPITRCRPNHQVGGDQ